MAWTAPKVDWTSIDGAAYGDFNEIGENLVVLKTHADATTGVHGAVSAPTASKFMIRDASGRAQVAAPDADADIARKDTVTVHTTNVANPHATTKTHVGLGNVTNNAQIPIAGGTFTGRAYAVSPDTSYTTAQIRNIVLRTTVPGAGDLQNGEVAFVYEV